MTPGPRASPGRPRALLAICSDLDATPDGATYFELMRFLNTTEDTSMGPGVGLEVGNSIYFDMPAGQFSYWNASPPERERLRALIRSGHIDCLHSFGDLATTRAHAGRALEELTRHGCEIKVWVDHAVAPTNFGADIMQGHGDEPGHEAYHADLSVGYGIRYVWRGRVTSVIGQDCRTRLDGIARWRHPLGSALTLGKEAAKHLLARSGHAKYRIHRGNRLLVPAGLRDGSPLGGEFLRCNPHWAGVSAGDRGDAIHEVLTPAFVDALVRRGGHCILYTHLGKLDPRTRRLDARAVAAFRMLAQRARRGEIAVTTTRRLLDALAPADATATGQPAVADVLPLRFPPA